MVRGGDGTTPISDEQLRALRAAERRDTRTRASLLLYLRDGVRVVPLSQGDALIIGRHAPADVLVRDAGLSREHAIVELRGGALRVRDLSSTNGTYIDGERIDDALLAVGSVLMLGGVRGALHLRADARASSFDALETHERFEREVAREVARARLTGRGCALLMVQALDAASHPASWLEASTRSLRPFDRVAMYSGAVAELLLPERDAQQALAQATALCDGWQLRCGVGLIPDHALTAVELFDVTRRALQQTSERALVELAASGARGDAQVDALLPGEGIEIGEAMLALYKRVERLASRKIAVLLTGETGVGKEVVARALHERGKRANAPMICVNCGAIPHELIESTLFGHEKGAFSGAGQRKAGVFEAADGGTVLLDEVGELRAAAQVALLRVLEDQRVTPIGATGEINVDVRVIAATHRDLEAMCEAGTFRRDLLFRLNAMTLRVPPLRERRGEIPALTRRFVERANEANDCSIERVASDAMAALECYSWPGNVRELRNAIERAVVIAEGDELTLDDLPPDVAALDGADAAEPDGAPLARPGHDAPTAGDDDDDAQDTDLRRAVADYEAQLIHDALQAADGDRKRAARALGLPLRTLHHKMRAHGIKREYAAPRRGDPA